MVVRHGFRTSVAGVVLLWATAGVAQQESGTSDSYVGRILSVRGEASVKPTGEQDTAVPLFKGDRLREGAIIMTEAGAAARLLMQDKSLLDIGPKSRLKVKAYRAAAKKKQRKVALRMFLGRLWARVTKTFSAQDTFEVETENAVAGVRGTEFVVDIDTDGNTLVTCVGGNVEVLPEIDGVRAASGQVLGAFDQSTVTPAGETSQLKVTPEQVKQMAQSVKSGGTLSKESAQGRLQQAAEKSGAAGVAVAAPGKGESDAETEEDSRFDDWSSDTPAPQVDLEPSSGHTRVRGTVEVRE